MWLAITYPKNFEMWPFCLLFVFQKCGRLTRRYLSKKIEMWKSCLLPNSAQIWAIDPASEMVSWRYFSCLSPNSAQIWAIDPPD